MTQKNIGSMILDVSRSPKLKNSPRQHMLTRSSSMVSSGQMFLNLFKHLHFHCITERESLPEGPELPVPLVNYVYLIRERRSPYYEIVEFLMKDMEMHLQRTGQGSETVYTINPRMLHEEIEKKVNDEKLTSVNVCRTVLAMLHGASLDAEKDYYVTTTSSGRKNYHVRVNTRTLNLMSSLL